MARVKKTATIPAKDGQLLAGELSDRRIEWKLFFKPKNPAQYFNVAFSTPLTVIDYVEVSNSLVDVYKNSYPGENDWCSYLQQKILIQSPMRPQQSSANREVPPLSIHQNLLEAAPITSSNRDLLTGTAEAWGEEKKPRGDTLTETKSSSDNKFWMNDNRVRQTRDILDQYLPSARKSSSASSNLSISARDLSSRCSNCISKDLHFQNSTSISFGLDVPRTFDTDESLRDQMCQHLPGFYFRVKICAEFLRVVVVVEKADYNKALKKWSLHAESTLSRTTELIDGSRELDRRFFGYCFVGLAVEIWEMKYTDRTWSSVVGSTAAAACSVQVPKSPKGAATILSQRVFQAPHNQSSKLPVAKRSIATTSSTSSKQHSVQIPKPSNVVASVETQPIFHAHRIARFDLADATKLENFVEWHARILEWAAVTYYPSYLRHLDESRLTELLQN